ncbi:hypothetical protein MCOR27_000585 [Pyricularia oryzae]|uniref:Uncharacterized protein n=1 Tax=Pyricularia grisea TaxID=148305 RepID=A0ABQ8NKR2_PYRGI|nr:hypothetical protein MCOR01_005540 [Pyricularia oryzae]KAI6298499.1 hypothetical protein MCOR33_005391 [Pyricularia grisea]KAI6280365.1 hypothetical protein MCOR26_003783 [Pyricularia oryzae]KAI6289014.1 hypothetical protein MCOR27_000585 [Pyricularia oryzae]KAI6327630.1 hypothetical protein MCOR29_002931 [Pyricularia oryzae]
MCHQINYTLPCEHVRTHTVYCPDATKSKSSSSSSSSNSNSNKNSSSKSSSKSASKSSHGKSGGKSSASSASSSSSKKPCKNLTQQSLPYPTPPSFAGSPMTAASSPLVPKCPLESCPFEAKNRCWNCCWCGKEWNEAGRCSCIMIIEGNHVQCEHICCHNCEAAWQQ